MKAKDYFDKYFDEVRAVEGNDSELYKVVNRIFIEFQKEAAEIIDSRGVKSVVSAMSVIEQQNKKWNALERRFEQAGFRPVLKKNGFLHAKLRQLEQESPGTKTEEFIQKYDDTV